MALEIKSRKINNDPVLVLIGRVIDVDVEKFSKKLESLCNKKTPRIIIDVTQANFIDSHGLGIVVYYNSLLQKEKRTLIVLNANPDCQSYVRRLFELTNLDKVLKTVSSEEELL